MINLNSRSISDCQKFGGLRSKFWPIAPGEGEKFVLVSLIMLCTLFIYCTVRDLKDSLLANMDGDISQSISILKIFLVLPVVFFAVMCLGKAIDKFGVKKTFLVANLFFLSFFLFFCLTILPRHAQKKVSEIEISKLISAVTQQEKATSCTFFEKIFLLVDNWPITVFYIVAELWGALIVSSLFWQIASKATSKNEEVRFFSRFSCIGSLGAIFSGCFTRSIDMKIGINNRISYISIALVISDVILVGLFLYLENKFMIKKIPKTDVKPVKKKVKFGFLDSFNCVLRSKYLIYISVITLSYGLAITVFDQVFKEKGSQSFEGGAEEFNNFLALVSVGYGIISIIISFFSDTILTKFKWKNAALMEPVFMMLFFPLFFVFSMLDNKNLKGIVLIVGIFADSFSKGIKNSIYDATRQIAYRPLEKRLKTKGQAAVEAVGGKSGKTVGSIFVLLVRSSSGGLLGRLNIVVPVIFLILLAWSVVIMKLGKYYEKLKKEEKQSYLKTETTDKDQKTSAMA
ncbi:MAG: NTP/NDP exchange transporter [Oscillospiraceae bacterium]|jgi:AAA family ATP:ADP antiporter|nr:NTP/NDP exchange transporter [Oscillospiraceae bacterium]